MTDDIEVSLDIDKEGLLHVVENAEYDIQYLKNQLTDAVVEIDDLDLQTGELTLTIDYGWELDDFLTIDGVGD